MKKYYSIYYLKDNFTGKTTGGKIYSNSKKGTKEELKKAIMKFSSESYFEMYTFRFSDRELLNYDFGELENNRLYIKGSLIYNY